MKFFADGAAAPPLYEPAEYNALILEIDKRGYQIMTHALSPQATHMVLEPYDNTEKVNGARDRPFAMEHATSVRPADLSMAPAWHCPHRRPLGAARAVQQLARYIRVLAPSLELQWQNIDSDVSA